MKFKGGLCHLQHNFNEACRYLELCSSKHRAKRTCHDISQLACAIKALRGKSR